MTTVRLRLSQAAMSQPAAKVGELCAELGITRQTLCRHVDSNSAPRPDGRKLIEHASRSARGPANAIEAPA